MRTFWFLLCQGLSAPALMAQSEPPARTHVHQQATLPADSNVHIAPVTTE